MSEFKPLALNSANFLEHLLPSVRLRDYQVRAAIHIALLDQQLLAFDTGLGKTISVLAGLVAKQNYGEKLKVLFLCPLAGMNQVYDSIRTFTKFRAVRLTGSEQGLNSFAGNLDAGVDIVLCNYEAFDNQVVLEIIHELLAREYFNCVVTDEAHTYANIYTSNRNFFIANVIQRIKYKYFLTATPIISDIAQYSVLLGLMLDKLDEFGSLNHRVKAGEFAHDRVPNLVQFKEREAGYKVQLHKFPSIKFTGTAYGTEIFKYTRGSNHGEVEWKIKEIISQTKGNVLIFSHLKSNHTYLAEVARSMGRNVGIISGDTNKDQTLKDYKAGLLDCVVFSIPTELNLPAEAIILHDWTSMAHQAIGRGIRSESAEGYTAHILLSETEKELSLFQNTVLKNSLYLSQAFGKDIQQLLELNKL
ncbi:SNF2-related protein [Lysinibacillus xylanilyticus]|uniref:SNF2-related protein n=1 Tax=Lysinibacillus xylanilyticus TaxID=582475 RepID=UPI0036DCA14B